MIKELAEYIEDVTDFTVGTDLFAGWGDADTPNDCIIVQEVMPSMTYPELADRVDKPIQVISRAVDFFTARDNAQAIFTALHGKWQITLPVVTSGEVYVVNIEGTAPYYIGLDDTNHRHVYSVNFLIKSQEG